MGQLVAFWDSQEWHRYERAYGDPIGTRSRLLATADWTTRVVDLSASEAELWQGVRRSYHSLIHKAERRYVVAAVDATAWMEACRQLHRSLAGRETRPAETWQLMTKWSCEGRGLLVVATDSEVVGTVNVVAFTYMVIHGAWAYFHSGGSAEDSLSHALIWCAMRALKARGVRWFEMGWNERPGDSEKERSISFFKRGFGGVDVSLDAELEG